MKRLMVCLAIVGALSSGLSAQTQKKDDPIITIEGAKNPELIPEWAAWRSAFNFMAAPAAPEVPIPSRVAVVTTAEQRAFIRKEALRVIKEENDIFASAAKLRDGHTAETLPQIMGELTDMEMRRRRVVLAGRDRLLGADLPTAAHAALREFVEIMRKGITTSMPKSELAQYALPE